VTRATRLAFALAAVHERRQESTVAKHFGVREPTSGMSIRTRLVTAVAGAIALVAFLASARTPVVAADDVTEVRAVGAFDRVRSDGVFTVHVTAGAREQKVVVRGAPDVVSRTVTETHNDTLEIRLRSGVQTQNMNRPIIVDIGVPALRRFENAGVGTAALAGLSGDVALVNSGTGTISAMGTATKETIDNSGVGAVDASGVRARDVSATSSGVGNVEVRVSGTLMASVSGIGQVTYLGNPTHVESHVSGLGNVGPG